MNNCISGSVLEGADSLIPPTIISLLNLLESDAKFSKNSISVSKGNFGLGNLLIQIQKLHSEQ